MVKDGQVLGAMKSTFALASLISCFEVCCGQWQSIDPGFTSRIRTMNYDALNGRLYCFGHFDQVGSLDANGVAYRQLDTWYTMGLGVDNPVAFPVVSSVISGDSIFVSGFFTAMSGVPETQYIALWDGSSWRSIGGNGATGIVWGFLRTSNGLLFCGDFTSIADVECNSVARLNSNTWSNVCSFPLELQNDISYTCAAEYGSEIYIGGNINGIPDLNEIGRLENDTLKQFGGGILGDSWVNDMVVFQDKLFVGGEFYSSSGNAASGLMTWDGISWADPFPGLTFTGQVHEILIHNEQLIFSGRCVVNGSSTSYQLGIFDGERLCLFAENVNAVLSPICIGMNEMLIVSPNVPNLVINGTPLGLLATYDLSFPADTCLEISTGLIGHIVKNPDWSIHPNPCSDRITIRNAMRSQQIRSIEMRDALGRLAYRARFGPIGMQQETTIELPELGQGSYSILAFDERGHHVGVKQVIVTH